LRGRHDGAFFGCKRRKSLRELRIAVVLARVGGSEELLGRRKFGFELRAFAAVRSPSQHDGHTKDGRDDQGNESKPKV